MPCPFFSPHAPAKIHSHAWPCNKRQRAWFLTVCSGDQARRLKWSTAPTSRHPRDVQTSMLSNFETPTSTPMSNLVVISDWVVPGNGVLFDIDIGNSTTSSPHVQQWLLRARISYLAASHWFENGSLPRSHIALSFSQSPFPANSCLRRIVCLYCFATRCVRIVITVTHTHTSSR